MSAGLDSLSATEFTSTLSERLSIEIEPTALYDYPSLDSLADFLSNGLATRNNDLGQTPPQEEVQEVSHHNAMLPGLQ
jgi:hypothetical protein